MVVNFQIGSVACICSRASLVTGYSSLFQNFERKLEKSL